MIRTRATDWRVQVLDENGRWRDHHVGARAADAITAYAECGEAGKRLLRNGEPLPMSDTSEQLTLWEGA